MISSSALMKHRIIKANDRIKNGFGRIGAISILPNYIFAHKFKTSYEKSLYIHQIYNIYRRFSVEEDLV